MYLIIKEGLWKNIFSYFTYLFSSYALIILSVWFWKNTLPLLGRIPFLDKLFSDFWFRERFFLGFALSINMLYAAYEMINSMLHKTLWFGVMALYYLILATARFSIMRYYLGRTIDIEREKRLYKRSGYLLLLLAPVISGISIAFVGLNEVPVYKGNLIYGVAAYAFFSLSLAITNLVRYRKRNRPALTANKCLALAAGLVAMFSLQAALMSMFGQPGEETFRKWMNICGGIVVFFAIVFMGTYMLRRRYKDADYSEEAEPAE